MGDDDILYYTPSNCSQELVQISQHKLVTYDAQMEDVREIARLQYEIAGEQVQSEAVKFFNTMDINGDGKVGIHELQSFLVDQGYPILLGNFKFWTLFDSDGTGALSFDEVRTLFYIITTGCHSCSNCSLFIDDGNFFSCPDCPTFHLCNNCFREAQPPYHVHDGRDVHFLDTAAYLETLLSRQSPTSSQPLEKSGEKLESPLEVLKESTEVSKESMEPETLKESAEVAFTVLTVAVDVASDLEGCAMM